MQYETNDPRSIVSHDPPLTAIYISIANSQKTSNLRAVSNYIYLTKFRSRLCSLLYFKDVFLIILVCKRKSHSVAFKLIWDYVMWSDSKDPQMPALYNNHIRPHFPSAPFCFIIGYEVLSIPFSRRPSYVFYN